MTKLLRALLIWIRKNPEREWYRRQEQSVRDSIIREADQNKR